MADIKRKVPNLRFKGFTDDWEQRKLGDVVNLIGGGPFKSTDSVSKGIPWLKIANVGVNGITWNTESYLPEYFWNDYPQYQLKKGNYVVALTRPILNHRLKISKLDRDALLNQRVAKLTTSENLQYIVHLLERKKVVLQIENNLSGSDPPNLSSKDLYRIKIKIPSESNEQKQIGTFLQNIDHIIALQQRKLALLKQLKKGLLQKMFADKDSKRPVLRFKGFHDDWEQRKVSDIFTVTRGQVLATTKISEVKTNEMYFPVYSSQTKNNGLMGYYNKYLFNTAITWTTDGANAGTVNYREGKFYSTNVNGVLLSDDGYANKAIAEILDRVAWRHVSRVGNPKLMNNVMSNIKISIPSSFEEQNAISEFLIKFDHLIALHQRKQNHLKLLKKSLLQQMFM